MQCSSTQGQTKYPGEDNTIGELQDNDKKQEDPLFETQEKMFKNCTFDCGSETLLQNYLINKGIVTNPHLKNWRNKENWNSPTAH